MQNLEFLSKVGWMQELHEREFAGTEIARLRGDGRADVPARPADEEGFM